MRSFNKVMQIGQARFGLTHDLVYEGGQPYLERWILWFGATLRLHCFHKGDDDRAFRDHPWWFITIPLRSYLETTPRGPQRKVHAFLPHFRSAKHRHIVKLIDDEAGQPRPVWTFIMTGPKSKEWGFWREEEFIHHTLWLDGSTSE